MHKDTVTAPMEPFTSDEETALYAKLDRLSVAELERYIGSARSSLGNRALNPTWRPRIELALKHAELAHIREEAAAALIVVEPAVAAAAPATPAKKKPKAKTAKAASPQAVSEADDEEDASEPVEGAEPD